MHDIFNFLLWLFKSCPENTFQLIFNSLKVTIVSYLFYIMHNIVKKLPDSAIKKIDSIIEKNITIIIGDAKGVDSGVQKYLKKKGV